MAAAKHPKKVGPYEVQRVIGRGGMGDVFVAEHPLLERKVALKRFRKAVDGDDTVARERFLLEGRALAVLQHETVVTVYDLFEYRGALWLVLEYVDGLDLAHLVKGGPLPGDVALIVAHEVASALAHIHLRGLVHRDIKPSNVMLSREGDVRVMDFGIVREEGLDRMTETGLVVGTPMYLAPEVVRGEMARQESDIYALGALLYFVLTGRRLFPEANEANLFSMIALGKHTPIHKVAPDLPRYVRAIVKRCLENRPERRYRAADDLRLDLARALDRMGATPRHGERLAAFMETAPTATLEETGTVLEAEGLVQSELSIPKVASLEDSELELPAAREPRTWAWVLVLLLLAAGGVGWTVYADAIEPWMAAFLAVLPK